MYVNTKMLIGRRAATDTDARSVVGKKLIFKEWLFMVLEAKTIRG